MIGMLQGTATTPSPQPSPPSTVQREQGRLPLPHAGEGWGRDGAFEPHAASPSSGIGLQADARTASEGDSSTTSRPTRTTQLINFLVFQSAWFAAVLGAAHQVPLWGTAAVLAAFAWHLSVSARPAEEAKLFAVVCVIGFVVETGNVLLGHVSYPSGQPVAGLAPYWMVALWGLLAITLNVTMRWMKGRYLLAAVLGAIAGPVSFVSGAKLGAAQFIHTTPALIIMAGTWALLMPALMRLSMRFDGVAVRRVQMKVQRA